MSAAERLDPEQVTITRFASRTDTDARPCTTTWPALFTEFGKVVSFRGDKQHPGWSAAEFDPPQRALANVRRVSALVLDVDNKAPDGSMLPEPITLDAMRAQLAGYYGHIHTSRNNTAAWPRFRVVLPLARPVTAAEYSRVWTAAAQRWPGVDPAPKDPSRFWFAPGVADQPGAEFQAVDLKGSYLDPDELLTESAPLAISHEPANSNGALREARARAYIQKMPEAISGAGGHQSLWAVARKLVADFGLDESRALAIIRQDYNPRCSPPWSEKELRHKVADAAKATVRNPVEDRSVLTWDAEAGEYWSPEAAQSAQTTKLPVKQGRTISDVLATWRADGPVIHEPTGIARLDDLTGGGLVLGTRAYLNGQPDAGKTALLIQLAHNYAQRGLAVGLLAVDEEDSDLVTRFAQRVGHSRRNCEIRSDAVLAQLAGELEHLALRFYDLTWTIEAAAADLAAFAGGRHMMMGIDSLQTVRCDAELTATREMSEMAAVTARVQAIRAVASRHKLIAVCTSEMSRSAYRKADPDDLTSTMAASKHSGAVEYSARILIGLRSVKGEPDLVEMDIAKNKLGPAGHQIYLRVDRATQILWEVEHEAPPPPDRQQVRRDRVADNAARVAAIIGANPGVTTRDLYAKCSAEHGLGKDAVSAAVQHLGDRITTEEGPRRARLMTLAVAN